MNAKERLNRLRNLREMASNLYRSIMAECNIALAEMAVIEETIAEGNRRVEAFEQMATWDGEQSDFWYISGSCWKRATAAHVGKMVRVGNKPKEKPTELTEAKLMGIGHGWYCCEGTKGQIVTWKYAWIESNPCDEDQSETKGYISIQVGSFYPGEPSLPVVKEDLKTEPAPTANESLTVEPRFRIGDWVRICKPEYPASPSDWEPDSMDKYDGKEAVIVGIDSSNPKKHFYVLDITDRWRFLEQFLKPALHQGAKEPEDEWRVPHPGDVGSIIQVRDTEDESHIDSIWTDRKLVAVIATHLFDCPVGCFVCAVEHRDEFSICHTWKFARIKKGS